MTEDDIESISFSVRKVYKDIKKECGECGNEIKLGEEFDYKEVTYKVTVEDGRTSHYTRSYGEPIGVFYDWLCNTVLPGTYSKDGQ